MLDKGEEGETLGSCQDLFFEGLEGCWCVCQRWSPGKSRAGEGQAMMSQLWA